MRMRFLADRRQRRQVVAALFSIAALPLLLGLLGGRINSTPSLAYGIYWAVDGPARRGGYATFCPLLERPAFVLARARGYIGAGRCAGGGKPLLKRVMAATGDVVSIDAHGVTVNGRLLPHSRPLQADAAGRVMPRLRLHAYRLAADEVLMMSDVSAVSFDARYFGPIPRQRLQESVRPLWTWPASR